MARVTPYLRLAVYNLSCTWSLFAGHFTAGNRLQDRHGNVGTPAVAYMVDETTKWQREGERDAKRNPLFETKSENEKKMKFHIFFKNPVKALRVS